MISRRIAIAFFLIFVCIISAEILRARGQSTARPGELTQARVWIENRAPNDAVPVIVENVAAPITAHLDSSSTVTARLDTSSTVQTVAARQTWQYRSTQLAPGAVATVLDRDGMDGWEAVGVLQSGPMGVTILFKRPATR
jgi:hypothetical protein